MAAKWGAVARRPWFPRSVQVILGAQDTIAPPPIPRGVRLELRWWCHAVGGVQQQAEKKANLEKLEQEAKKLRDELQDKGGGNADKKGARYVRMSDNQGNVWWEGQWRQEWEKGEGKWR